LVYSLGLNNPPHICLTPRKVRVKNVWCNKQGNCWCKMAGAGIRSLSKFRGQIPRIDTTGITFWKPLSSGLRIAKFRAQVAAVAIRSQIDTSVCSNPHDGYSILGNPRSKHRGLCQSAAHIWVRNLARDSIPAPAILHRESPCLKRYIFLPRDF
jgi:hypothetical protein